MVNLFSKNFNLCDHNSPTSQTDGRTDRQMDRQTTCDRNTALCIKVHCAVKTTRLKKHTLSVHSESTWHKLHHRSVRLKTETGRTGVSGSRENNNPLITVRNKITSRRAQHYRGRNMSRHYHQHFSLKTHTIIKSTI